MELRIGIGAMSPSIYDQLIKQGVKVTKKECEHFQKDVDSLNRLRIRGLITDSESHKANQRFMKMLTKELEK